VSIIFQILTETRRTINQCLKNSRFDLEWAIYQFGMNIAEKNKSVTKDEVEWLSKIAVMSYKHSVLTSYYTYPKKRYGKERLKIEKDWVEYTTAIRCISIEFDSRGGSLTDLEESINENAFHENIKITEKIERKFEILLNREK